MPRLHLHYYAILRERSGRQSETVDTPAATPAALYAELAGRYRFGLPATQLRVAVNGAFADWGRELADDDEIVFIPPVAGG